METAERMSLVSSFGIVSHGAKFWMWILLEVALVKSIEGAGEGGKHGSQASIGGDGCKLMGNNGGKVLWAVW